MNILLFGATGGTGRQVISQGIQAGHHITAFVRNPKSLQVKSKLLKVITGNILSQKDVQEVVKGQDVVISTLGNKTSHALWETNHTISDGVKNIISAMKKEKVRRLLFVASFGVNEKIFLPEKLFIKVVLKNIFADIPLQEQRIKESGLDWTLVHPARLTTVLKIGKYHAQEDLPIGIFSQISRAGVADFLLNNISNRSVIGKTITLSY